MAYIDLGSVKIINSTIVNLSGDETYSDNDKIYIYLNDSTDGVEAYLNPTDPRDPTTGTLQTSGNFISQVTVSEGAAIVKSNRYSVCSGTNLIRYYKEGSVFWDADFPYFSSNVDVDSPACAVSPPVCDLQTATVTSTDPSTTVSEDGTIEVFAVSSDSGGMQFALEQFEYGNGFQATALPFTNVDGQTVYLYEFTGLKQGTYTVYAKDSLGCSGVFDPVVLNGTQADASFGTRYVAEFTDDGNTTVSPNTYDNYRVLIKEKGYSGSSSTITYMSGEPLTISVGSSGSKYSPVRGSRIDFKIKSVTNNQYTSVFFGDNDRTISDGKIIIEVYQNDTLIKKGYFLSDGYSEPYMDAPYDISLRFIDGLADLSSKLYQNISGLDSAFNVVLSCLREIKLPAMKLRVISGTYPSADYDASGNLTVDASACSLMSAYINLESYDGLSFRDTLEGVLQSTPEPMTIRSEGNYFIIQPDVLDASSYTYLDYTLTGDYDASGTFNPYKDEGKIRSGSDTSLSGNMTRDSVFRKIKVVEDRIVRDSVFNNFTIDNIVGDPVDEQIVGTGFLGYNNILNGDSGSFEVRKAVLSNDRPDSKLISTETISTTITRQGYNDQNGFDRWGSDGREEVVYTTKVRKSDIGSAVRNSFSDNYFLFFNFQDAQGGNAYVTSKSNIESNTEDDFEFSFNYFIDLSDVLASPTPTALSFGAVNIPSPPPYLKLKYQLQATDASGNNYYLNGNDWVLNPSVGQEPINTTFITDYGVISSFSVNSKMPVDSDVTITFRIYDLDPYYTDFNGTASDLFSSLDASGLPLGYRIITGNGGVTSMEYFELQDEETADSAISYAALNRADARWVHVTSNRLISFVESSKVPNCDFGVGQISFITKPKGSEFDDEFKEEQSSSSDNLYDLEYPVFHFNIRGEQTNERGMLLNYWRDASGSPLSGWGIDDKLSQSIILDELLGQYRNPSQKININARYFSQVNATNTIRITYDSNRLFKFNSYTWMPKSRMITGEIVEIGIAGQEISIGEYSSAFNSAFNI